MSENNQTVNNKKLFVGNLPFGMTDATLTDLFSQYGEIVSARVIFDRNTGRSKGFAFVEFATAEAAEAAIAALDGQEIEGRKIVVNVARPMAPRTPGRDFHHSNHSDSRRF